MCSANSLAYTSQKELAELSQAKLRTKLVEVSRTLRDLPRQKTTAIVRASL